MTVYPSLEKLYQALGYRFHNETLILQALVHRSYGHPHNERLEFLGDSILNMVISTTLYERFPNLNEGDLTRMRASLVKGETLAELGHRFSLGDYLRLGQGECRSGGHRRDSILADGIEAIIGAMYLDAGLEVMKPALLSWYAARLSDPGFHEVGKDPKTRLQEWLQGKGQRLPEYDVQETQGPQHDQWFVVQCKVAEWMILAQGEGKTRRYAEQMAARLALEQIQHDKK